MIDRRWIALARRLSEWPDAHGGYVVTRGGRMVSASSVFGDVAKDCPGSTLYMVHPMEYWNEGELDEVARIVVPRDAPAIHGLDLDVEIDEVST